MEKFKKIFKNQNKIIIGMLHFPFISNINEIDLVSSNLLENIENLQTGGIHAILFENEYARYRKEHPEFLDVDEIIYYTTIVNKVLNYINVPYGFTALDNDYKTSLSLSSLLKGKFIRLDVFVDHVSIHGNIIKPQPIRIKEYRNHLLKKYKCDWEISIYTDIHSKWGQILNGKNLKETIQEAIDYESDGIIINGNVDHEYDKDSIKNTMNTLEIAKNITKGNIPIFVGSGVNENNIKEYLTIANGVIIGRALKENNKIKKEKVENLIRHT